MSDVGLSRNRRTGLERIRDKFRGWYLLCKQIDPMVRRISKRIRVYTFPGTPFGLLRRRGPSRRGNGEESSGRKGKAWNSIALVSCLKLSSFPTAGEFERSQSRPLSAHSNSRQPSKEHPNAISQARTKTYLRSNFLRPFVIATIALSHNFH